DDFSTDIVLDMRTIQTVRSDSRCKSGRRKIEFIIEFYRTVTITGKFVPDPKKEGEYIFEGQTTVSATKTRVKPGSYKEGDCQP
ncbi:MAG: hypothetical protein ACRDEA_13145, partial [Microcystaceae cyanobacterium]